MRRLSLIIAIFGVTTFVEAKDKKPNVIPDEELKILQSPAKATLYSLEPDDQPKKDEEQLCGYKVLGKVEIDGVKEQMATSELQKAVRNWDGLMASCFDPREGLEIRTGGHTYDFLICYSCHYLYVYKDSTLLAVVGAAGSRKILDDILTVFHISVSHSDERKQSAEEAKMAGSMDRCFSGVPAPIKKDVEKQFYSSTPDVSMMILPLKKGVS